MLFLLALLNIPAIKSLFYSGYFSSHDGHFHLVRLVHFYNEILRGQFPVRYSFDLAYGYGYPIFTFFYPLTNYLGSLLHLIGFDFNSSLRILFGFWMIFSSIFCYLWLKKHFSKTASFIGSLVYSYVPYRFLALYVTGSIGIITAMGIAPLLMLSIYRIIRQKDGILLFSLSISLIILSHNVSALIFLIIGFFYGITLWSDSKQKIVILKKSLISFVLLILMTSFFVFPLIINLNNVRLKTNIAAPYQDHFPTLKQLLYSPWGYGTSITGNQDNESFQIGLAQWFVIFCVCINFIFLILNKKLKHHKLPTLIFTLLASIIFLMLEKSEFIWINIKILQQIQFPWRLLMATSLLISFLSAWLISTQKFTYKIILGILIIFLCFYTNRNYLRPLEAKVRYPDEKYLDDGGLFYGSTDISWESLPKWVKIKPYFVPTKVIYSYQSQYQHMQTQNLERFKIITKSLSEETLTANIFYYPNWVAIVEKDNQTIFPQTRPDQNGLLQFNIPEGNTITKLVYQKSKLEKIADIGSVLGWSIWFIYLFLLKKTHLCRGRESDPHDIAITRF